MSGEAHALMIQATSSTSFPARHSNSSRVYKLDVLANRNALSPPPALPPIVFSAHQLCAYRTSIVLIGWVAQLSPMSAVACLVRYGAGRP
jgi:hypothetical protein